MDTSKTVERAIRILKCFSRSEPVITIPMLVQRLALPRTVVVRLVKTLESAGLVERVPNQNGYRIGRAAFEIGTVYLAANPFFSVATHALQRLADETGSTVSLAVVDGAEALYLARFEGRFPIRFAWEVGDRMPVTATAAGKAVLMYYSKGQLDALIGRGEFPVLTEHSTRTRVELDRQLELARERGWIVATDEVFEGASGVGAAILDSQGQPVAGISLSFLTYSATPERVAQLGAQVASCAREISRQVRDYDLYGARIVPQDRIG